MAPGSPHVGPVAAVGFTPGMGTYHDGSPMAGTPNMEQRPKGAGKGNMHRGHMAGHGDVSNHRSNWGNSASRHQEKGGGTGGAPMQGQNSWGNKSHNAANPESRKEVEE